jgi:hypothetical protein
MEGCSEGNSSVVMTELLLWCTASITTKATDLGVSYAMRG